MTNLLLLQRHSFLLVTRAQPLLADSRTFVCAATYTGPGALSSARRKSSGRGPGDPRQRGYSSGKTFLPLTVFTSVAVAMYQATRPVRRISHPAVGAVM